MHGRVGKLKTRVGKRKNFSALSAEFYQTNVCPPWPETLPVPLGVHDIFLCWFDSMWHCGNNGG